ncbi:MAG TPA: NmrA/HSCARG family protein [Candidatus Deferrimicrobiaceae bacterium]
MTIRDGVLVTGITGHQGGAVADSLLQHRIRVVGLTRDIKKASAWKARGAELVQGDLSDRKSLDRALETVDKVYLVTTPFENGMEAEVLQGTTMIDAARDADIRHLVFSSVVSADGGTGIPHFETKGRIEAHLKKSGVPFTIIRPAFFMENFLSPWLLPGIQAGKVTMGVDPDCWLQMVSIRDIGEFVLAAFRTPDWYLRQTIEIAGDTLTIPGALGLISEAIGHPIRYERLPDNRLEEAVGPDMARMYRWFNTVGYKVDIPELEKLWDIPMTLFHHFAFRTSWPLSTAKAA